MADAPAPAPGRSRVASLSGLLLVAAVALFFVGRLLEPGADRATTVPEKMEAIRDAALLQRLSHILYALAFAGLVGASSLIVRVLVAAPGAWPDKLGWGLLGVTALPLALASALGATLAASAAVAGDESAFQSWDGWVARLFHAFLPMQPLGVVLIGVGELRAKAPLTHRWGVAGAIAASAAAFIGLVAGLYLDLAALGRLGLALALSLLWIAWAGVSLLRYGRRVPA